MKKNQGRCSFFPKALTINTSHRWSRNYSPSSSLPATEPTRPLESRRPSSNMAETRLFQRISSLVSEPWFEYDVFLSLGEDTRDGFTKHIYEELVRMGVRTFLDSEELEAGDNIAERMFTAIRGSMIFVVIFSVQYAHSRWCLMELEDIVKCNRLIIPVFVHVNPVDVQEQEGIFGSLLPGFTDIYGEEIVNRWKEALREAGNCYGFTLDDDRNEAELIRKVVKMISLQHPFNDDGMRRHLNDRQKAKATEPSSSSSPPRTIDKPTYDVFLSFRGKDTRKGFTGHLYESLCQRGISTFIDSKELERGERIEELFNYIEASKIFVAVLSKGYADSRWCMREITKRVECGGLIIPIFLGVLPACVRKQMGPFRVAFQWHKSCNIVGEEDLRKWKDALSEVGIIKGYSLQNNTNGNEAELIRKVVKQISLKMELPFDEEGMKRGLNGREQKTAEPTSSSLPSRTIDKPRFDVFLSFSGKDTRKGFTSHLYNALIQRGISTFIDSEELEKGERIEELFRYIEASKIFVPIVSKGYSDSKWCLREITKMVECGRLIIPIFFDVDPRDVRKLSGPFQLDKGNDGVREEDLSKWKDALGAVGKISGYSLQNDTNGNEADLIQNVVEQISRKLNKNAWPFTEHLVGMDSHIDKMYRLLDLTDKEVKMIGIVGMGGVGKTTIATVVHNRLLSDFEDSSFISDVREGFKQHNGGVTLQQKLIKHILKNEHSDIYSIKHGASLIRERLCFKRVLVILDDTDHIEQLKALAGERDWFGPGSRIIITSRDSRVLLNHGVKKEHIYRPELLDDENSFKLFESHAFRGVRPTESEYLKLSMEFVKVTGGLPLALGVFGSLLWERNIKQWKEILQKLIQIPNTDIDGRLRISYDALEENVKQIFLDISCFLIGEHKEYATYMWESCGLYPETAIAELQERSLISINKHDEFEMHDLVRDMGRGIIAQQGELWQRSRLRNMDDLLDSLAYKDKLRRAKGIVNAQDYTQGLVNLNTKDFVDFFDLRLLHLYGIKFKGEFLGLPRRLQWLRLSNCQFLNGLSGASNLNAISVLELIHVDDVNRILMEAFNALKVLHLEYSLMTRTPDFSKMKMFCLRRLTLRNCKMLMEVDGSIGSLKSLVHLDLRRCSKLQRLPDSICTLMSLETLILIGCNSLSSLPQTLGEMKSLRELLADYTSIRTIPDSVGDLSNLRTLSLIGNPLLEELPDSMRTLDSLKELYIINHPAERYGLNLINLDSVLCLNECTGAFKWLAVIPNSSCEKVTELTIEDGQFQELPPYLGRLTNLEALSIRCIMLSSLPEWLGQLQKLKSFELVSYSLDSICEGLSLASSVEELYIRCWSIEALPVMAGRTFENLRSLELNCRALKHVPDWIASVGRLEKLSLSGCRSITFLPTSMAHLIGTLCHLDLSDSALSFLTDSMCASGCSVRTLNLSRTNISGLPSSMSNLAQLEKLHLKSCKNLQSLPPLPSSLHVLDARYCNNLRTISDVSNLKSLKKLKLGWCTLLGDFCGLESIAHNLETLELPGPCGGLSGFSQLSPAFMTRVFKAAVFSSLKTFCVCARGQYGQTIPYHSDHQQPFWIMFPKVGGGGKQPTWVNWSFLTSRLPEEQKCSVSMSIVEEDGHAVYQCTTGNLYQRIRGEEIAEYWREGSYLKMQVSAFTLNLDEASLDVRYT